MAPITVIKCKSEYYLMREFSLRDDFNPEDKYMFLPEYAREFCWNKLPEETDQEGLGPLV